MTAELLVEGTFHLQSRLVFVVHGRVLDGVLHVGQRAASPAELDAPIAAVEFVRVAGGKESPAACFQYRDEQQLKAWATLPLVGQTISFGPAADDRPREE